MQTFEMIKIELHGFADASEKAYAAVVYIKYDEQINIVAAKSKVNPMKNRKTLPNLELCAAHLLSKLIHRIIITIKQRAKVYTINLCWIENNKSKDKFIRTRVNDIKDLIPSAKWNHVVSKENLADIASRGISPNELQMQKLWWNGPDWLRASEDKWPQSTSEKTTCAVTGVSKINKDHPLDSLTEKYSSFQKLIRIFAYVLRFKNKLQKLKFYPQYLTSRELKAAEIEIIKRHQHKEFENELEKLLKKANLKQNSKLANLYPFIDSEGVLRLGGRLKNSNISCEQKHPAIINKSHLAWLIVMDAHNKTLHGGNQLMEATIRRKYWVINLKRGVKKCIRHCVKCIRNDKKLRNKKWEIYLRCEFHSLHLLHIPVSTTPDHYL
uniref:Integrase zinc-binding domain-containing protein n=1 Tax=Ceratitis capitata TaxID=7213 RepID=W8BRZ3_CERCA